jgi:hypothetical protein
MNSVLITVLGGVAEVVASPKEVDVEIIDLDALREGVEDDVREYWRGLSARARRYVESEYPQIARSARE